MSKNLNELTVQGALGQDVELRYTSSGQPVANFSVASNDQYNNAAGEKVSTTTWFRVSAWGKLAEICNQYLSKGSKIIFKGRLSPEIKIYQTSGGESKANYEVTMSDLFMLGGGSGSNANTDTGTNFDTPPVVTPDEDLPF